MTTDSFTQHLSDQPQRSSPTRRVAACRSDIALMGRSQALIEVMKQVRSAANTDLPVLLAGESGTGRELVASAIHQRSGRADKQFVAVNCGEIPASLIEAELFGYVNGSFAGADRDGRGLWDEADGGTLFLNEITETTNSFQVKLLRALQGEIGRVGSNQTERINVRVIAASNRNVDHEVTAGRFSNDLYHRLNAVSIGLPPLRERPEDIPTLAQSLADCIYSFSQPVKFSSKALALLERYYWPGNIRELEKVVVRAVAMCDGTIGVKELPQRVRNYTQKQPEAGNNETATGELQSEEWVPLSEIEGRYVAQVLTHTRGNKQAAARLLAVDRKTLDRMIKRHHIDLEQTRRADR